MSVFLEAFLKMYLSSAPMNTLLFDHNDWTNAYDRMLFLRETTAIDDSDVSLEFLENQSIIYYLLSISSCLCIVFIVAIAVVPETV